MSEWLATVCAGRWQLHGIQRAKAVGLKVLAIDDDPEAPGLDAADIGLVAKVRNPKAILDVVRKAGLPIKGAIAFCTEVGMESAAALREALGLPGPNLELTGRLTDKIRQRTIWAQAGVPGPSWCEFRTLDQARRGLQAVGLPAIMKPADSAGSRGVTRLDSTAACDTAAERALKGSRSGRALIESHMSGLEYTVETFAIAGETHVLAVTEKVKVPGTGDTVAQELSTPNIEPRLVESITNAAIAALTALGHTDGPGHTEIILRPNGKPGLVEAAGRGGGFMVFDALVPKVSGFDIAAACALQAVGRPVPPPIIGTRKAVTLRFFPSRAGVVAGFLGFEAANAIPGVEAAPFVDKGQLVGQAKADGDRMGYILTQANSTKEARVLADRAEKLISFDIRQEARHAASH